MCSTQRMRILFCVISENGSGYFFVTGITGLFIKKTAPRSGAVCYYRSLLEVLGNRSGHRFQLLCQLLWVGGVFSPVIQHLNRRLADAEI